MSTDRENLVSPLCADDNDSDDHLIHFDDDCERPVEEWTDDDEVDSDANVPLETVGRNVFGSKKEPESKYRLRSSFKTSSKHMLTVEELNVGERRIGGVEIGQVDEKTESNPDVDELTTMMKRYLSEECDFSVSVPESVKNRVQKINYLPKISCRTQNPSRKDEPDTSRVGSEESKSHPFSKLSGWNRLDDMNKKCSKWLDEHDASKTKKPQK